VCVCVRVCTKLEYRRTYSEEEVDASIEE